jgi:hypothetical protein
MQMKTEYHDSYLGIFFGILIKKILEPEVIHQPTASPNFLPKKNRTAETEYGYIMQPLTLDSQIGYHIQRKIGDEVQNNDREDLKDKPKKKRKGNKEEAIAQGGRLPSPKLKKAKSERIFSSI